METVILPHALAQAIHDYLMTRPMGEVEQMVVALRRARPNGSAAVAEQN